MFSEKNVVPTDRIMTPAMVKFQIWKTNPWNSVIASWSGTTPSSSSCTSLMFLCDFPWENFQNVKELPNRKVFKGLLFQLKWGWGPTPSFCFSLVPREETRAKDSLWIVPFLLLFLFFPEAIILGKVEEKVYWLGRVEFTESYIVGLSRPFSISHPAAAVKDFSRVLQTDIFQAYETYQTSSNDGYLTLTGRLLTSYC